MTAVLETNLWHRINQQLTRHQSKIPMRITDVSSSDKRVFVQCHGE